MSKTELTNEDIIIEKLSEEDGGGYFGYYKEIKTIMSDSETEEQCIENVKTAYKEYIEITITDNK